MHSEETGFYFPNWVEEKIFNGFIEKLIQQIHRFFFNSKSNLKQNERQDFIEILYQFLVLKLIEITNPTSFSLTCKDAIDSGASSMCQFYCFTKAITGSELKKEDIEKLNMLLYSFPMLLRQRCIKSDRFNRFIQWQKKIERRLSKYKGEKVKEAIIQHFGMLYDIPLDKLTYGKSVIDQMLKDKEG